MIRFYYFFIPLGNFFRRTAKAANTTISNGPQWHMNAAFLAGGSIRGLAMQSSVEAETAYRSKRTATAPRAGTQY